MQTTLKLTTPPHHHTTTPHTVAAPATPYGTCSAGVSAADEAAQGEPRARTRAAVFAVPNVAGGALDAAAPTSGDPDGYDQAREAAALVTSETTARGRLFGRWMLMLGKDPRRCAMGPQRARAVDQWVQLYGEDTLALAIDGAAGDAWVRERAQCSSLEWIFANEGRIERFAEQGSRAHADVLARRERQRAAASKGLHLRDAATGDRGGYEAAADAADPARRAAAIEGLLEVRARLLARGGAA